MTASSFELEAVEPALASKRLTPFLDHSCSGPASPPPSITTFGANTNTLLPPVNTQSNIADMISQESANLIQRYAFGRMLRERRNDLNISQEELAERVGKSQSWVTKLERGGIAYPRIATIKALANALLIDEDDLIVASTMLRERSFADQFVIEFKEAVESEQSLKDSNDPATQVMVKVLGLVRELQDDPEFLRSLIPMLQQRVKSLSAKSKKTPIKTARRVSGEE